MLPAVRHRGRSPALTQFNEHESADSVIRRLIAEANADIVVQVDCADARVNFEVKGWFVVPDKAVWKVTGESGA